MKLMEKQKTRNLTIDAKTILFKQEFPDLQISRSTVWKIQRKYLNYSFKRITKYRPKKLGNALLKRIAFIKEYLRYLENEKYLIFVIDEAGFGNFLLFTYLFIGSKQLRHYSYSQIGEPAILIRNKSLDHNLSCIATISYEKVEMV